MTPSTQIPPWQKEGDEKSEAVRRMFSEIAPTYDLANSIMSAKGHFRWRSEACDIINLKPGDSVLDICCGTGDFLIAARQKVTHTGKLVGLDFCQPMLEIAQNKVDQETELTLGDASRLPFASESFDAVTVGWGLRNVPDLMLVLHEVNRVLKPGGRFVCIDMSQPSGIFGTLSRWAYHVSVPLLGTLLKQKEAYSYLPKSTEKFLTVEELKTAFENAGFTKVAFTKRYFGNIAIHWGIKG